MQRASESIGALAAALARAQTLLTNPEKSLVATIREEGRHGREQTFRYAPLSSGLDIVRKCWASTKLPPFSHFDLPQKSAGADQGQKIQNRSLTPAPARDQCRPPSGIRHGGEAATPN
jgi:hypothetical protein